MKPILIALTVSLSLALRATGAEITNQLAHGHADVGVGYEEGELNLHVHAHDPEPGVEYEPGEVWLVVGPHARQLVGTNAAYAFLGAPGSPVWILPQFHAHEEEEGHAHEELLFLGLGAEEIATNLFVGDQVQLRLVSVTGPGQFSLFTADEFGGLTVHLNSGDGVSSNDTVTVPVGSHGHFNWAFTAPGEYAVTLEATGTLLAGNSNLTTGPVTYHFQVLDLAQLEHGHADVGIGYEEGELNLHVHAHDPAPGMEYEPGEVWLVVGPHARQLVGTNAAYAFLGAPGSPVWILPQFHSHEGEGEGHAHEELLFLGLGAEEIATNVFVGNQLKVRLVSVAGPGQFSLFTADEFGGLTVHLNSGDGVSSNDMVTVPAGSHGHFNWGFTAPGEYAVTLEATGTLLAGNSNLTTGPVTYHFQVLDPATTPPEEARLRLAPHTAGQLRLLLEDIDTRTFILESSTNLRDWLPISTNTVQNGIIVLPVNASQQPGAFFRARWQSR